jgi:hypothetical protein
MRKPLSPVLTISFFIVGFIVLSSMPARADFTKTINVVPNVQVNAVTTWYYANCDTSLGLGSYTINVAPNNGALAFGTISAPVPGCPPGSPSLPAAVAYYTWTAGTSGPTSDYFQLYFMLNGEVAEVIDITVQLDTLKITTTSLPDATTHVPYSATLATTGGQGTITWTLGQDQVLPAGFQLSPSGVLSSTGTPPAPSNLYPFIVVATDSTGASVQAFLNLYVAGEGHPVQTEPPPPFSTSWYVNANSRKRRNLDSELFSWMLTAGFNQGQQQLFSNMPSTVVLFDFGRPLVRNGQYGAAGFGKFRSLTAIETAVESFALGYYVGTGADNTLQLRIVVGTSNCCDRYEDSAVGYAHGQAWLGMVQNVGAWLNAYDIGSEVSVRGGSDMELAYSSAFNTYNWVAGYSATSAFPYYLYDYGDANGCPPFGNCANGWSQENVAYVSWEAPLSYPLPEIYSTGGGNASEWQQLSAFSSQNYEGGNMFILGPLTEMQACQQLEARNPRVCDGINNSPADAWSQLSTALDGSLETAQGMLWSTDLKYRVNPAK